MCKLRLATRTEQRAVLSFGRGPTSMLLQATRTISIESLPQITALATACAAIASFQLKVGIVVLILVSIALVQIASYVFDHNTHRKELDSLHNCVRACEPSCIPHHLFARITSASKQSLRSFLRHGQEQLDSVQNDDLTYLPLSPGNERPLRELTTLHRREEMLVPNSLRA